MPNSLWNAPIDKIEFTDVVSFCAAQLKESISLDYKEKFSSTNAGKQIAKEVSALANTYGGLIIYGVSEAEDRLPEANPEGKDLGERPRDRVIQACHANIFPPFVPEVSDLLPNPENPTRGFVVIRVTLSPASPHSIDDGKRTYVRVHDKSEPDDVSQSKFEAMLERRRTRSSAQKERVDLGIGRLMSALEVTAPPVPASTGYIAVAVGPTILDSPSREFASTAMHHLEFNDNTLLPVADGYYGYDRASRKAFLADDFGNIIGLKSGDGIVQEFTPNRLYASFYPWITPGDSLQGIRVFDVLEPLVEIINAAFKTLMDLNYFGEVRVFVVAESLVELPLIDCIQHDEVVAATMTDSRIEFEVTMSFSSIGPEGWNASVMAAEKLLWSWGKHPHVRTKQILHSVEKGIFGWVACPKALPGSSGHDRPINHALCLRCREGP